MKAFYVLLLAISAVVGVARSEGPPNFLVIVADDLGFSDLGCYGGEVETPNLDALAAGGLRFTQFYNTSRCWPTRAALLSGYYPQQIRRDAMPGIDHGQFGGSGVRPAWARLVSERLRERGYRSYLSGKWHVDGDPMDNGFDRSYWVNNRAGFFHLLGQYRDGESIPDVASDQGKYLTGLTADYAIEFLKEHASKHTDRPFFQYLAFHAPHFPLHAEPQDIARYRDRYLVGWDRLRKERHARQTELGFGGSQLSALDEDIGPPYAFPDGIAQLGPGEINRPVPWERLTGAQRRFQATKMAVHAAMIDRMDSEIGRVLDQLRAMDAFENTVVFFMSDNGASAEIMVRGDGHDPDAPLGSAGTYLCLGPGFSSAANTPFRLHKTWVHEGGISTPLILHWPEGCRGAKRTTVDCRTRDRHRPDASGPRWNRDRRPRRRAASRGRQPGTRIRRRRRCAARCPVVLSPRQPRAATGQLEDPAHGAHSRRRVVCRRRGRGCTAWRVGALRSIERSRGAAGSRGPTSKRRPRTGGVVGGVEGAVPAGFRLGALRFRSSLPSIRN